jgi:uncharacterized protein (DUF2235 family)
MNTSHLNPNPVPPGSRRSNSDVNAAQEFGFEDTGPTQLTMNPFNEQRRAPQKLVLCFDGTGNKFRGDDSDSNILKIFRCLDREANDQYHYYQPGIGTYVVSNSLSHTSVGARCRSWYLKAKDSAIGSSFDHHVVGGYRFLMRFYNPGDEIYFFGFSRGAYVARFLAEMLDYVGLLSHGNEEMVTFAWKAFSQWQSRQSDDTPEHQEKRREMYRFMKGFRETFSRPIKRLRFLGLFDCVNSVPRFETAWMQRSKFPYTARSSAKVIRHCVSIDERRAKFRQDLIYQGSQAKKKREQHGQHKHFHDIFHDRYRARRPALSGPPGHKPSVASRGRRETLAPTEHAYRPHSRSRSRTTRGSPCDQRSLEDAKSEVSHIEYGSDSEDDDQDIDEIWFAGGHGDVGGGWEVPDDSKSASHIPLAYMVREAMKAGLAFDPDKLVDLGVTARPGNVSETQDQLTGAQYPEIRIDISSPSPVASQSDPIQSVDWDESKGEKSKGDGEEQQNCGHTSEFHQLLHKAHLACIHDSLQFKSGLSAGQVLSWKIMEYMPFRRMDLQPDGSWKPIRWPLPCGEVRDIPATARIHGSVIRRLQTDENYRPGNLIVGGGGRGMRIAPKEHGSGEWECIQGHGDPVGEIWVRKHPPQNGTTNGTEEGTVKSTRTFKIGK